jgi:uncharacterized membrane-anchored protein
VNEEFKKSLSKVPEVTLAFWIIKIAATTLGETGGDAVSMTMQLGYALASIILIGIVIVAVFVQIMAKSFHPLLYWAVIVATTTAGTTMADFADRSLGMGYPGGASILFVLLLGSLGVWYWSEGLRLGQFNHDTKGGNVLLGNDHVFPNLGNGARRLDGR